MTDEDAFDDAVLRMRVALDSGVRFGLDDVLMELEIGQ